MDPHTNLDVSYANKIIVKPHDTKFLGLLSWKLHIEHILHMLSSASYARRSIKHYMSQEVMKMVYYAYFPSTVT
jgi:hypothetical protein